MKSNNLTFNKEEREFYLLIYILIIFLISTVLISLRIVFSFFQEESMESFFIDLLMKNRDLNFKTNYELMYNGIIHYYENNPLINETAIYLYFWYFIFYPFYLIPLEISFYIWDITRFISTIYIAIRISKLAQNRKTLLFFFLFSGIGYLADMYLNNTNWLIQLLLCESYFQLEKDRKLFSGFLFTLVTFKIILIIFPFILVIIKRIKVKDLIFYFIPFSLICIPYIIFPDYLIMMVSNWFQSASISSGFSILNIFSAIWRLIQPAHLIFISVIIVIILINIKDEKVKTKIGSFIYLSVFFIWVALWLIIIEVALFF